jgi:hypothetical protein
VTPSKLLRNFISFYDQCLARIGMGLSPQHPGSCALLILMASQFRRNQHADKPGFQARTEGQSPISDFASSITFGEGGPKALVIHVGEPTAYCL